MSQAATRVRTERPEDAAAVRTVLEAAFHGSEEADLVERVRARGGAVLALVAEVDGRVVGHALYTEVELTSPVPVAGVLALGPIGVHPDAQRRGVGSTLVRDGRRRLDARGTPAVVVLGDPGYYARFGFVPASRFGIDWERQPGLEAFQAIELRRGALSAGGLVRYAPEFG